MIIVGGGLSGLAMSCLLGQGSLRVACIDQQEPKAALAGDLRTTAISYGSSKILERAGIWPLDEDQMCAIQDIEILDGHSPVLLEFLSHEVDNKAFGWIVLNADLRTRMMDVMASLKTVDHFAPAEVQGFEIEENAAHVILKNGHKMTASLIIGADGRRSMTRNFMNSETRQWSYKQRSVVSQVYHEHPHNNIAVEHFWPEGPFAILPMSDDDQGRHRSAVVFTEHGKEQDSWSHFDDRIFETALAARFPERYGDIKLAGPKVTYPLGLVHASSYIAPRMALVADAAHGIHPIAGQGLNLGFRDLDTLSTLLIKAYSAGEDLGSDCLLEEYERIRRPDNMAMVAFTDGLVRLFSNNSKSLGIARRLGMRAVSRLRPAKRFFMKKAMGEG